MHLMHSYEVRGQHDAYATPAVAVEALLKVERLPHRIYEPAAGDGAIVRVLRAAGHAVIASDIHDYGFRLHFRRDFLLETKAPAGIEAIVTNPPFRLAEEFVAHALELVPLAIFLLRLSFLESERRRPILDGGKLARVHVFRNRLPFLHRRGWQGPRATSAIPFAWFCWSRDHVGPAIISRISWER
jgi:hypothetical protein